MSRNTTGVDALTALTAEYTFMRNTDGDRYIAQILLKNITQIPSLTVEKAAELCSVSPSTFHRFCRSMGYRSFTEFKVKMSSSLEKHRYRQLFTRPQAGTAGSSRYFDDMSAQLCADIANLQSTLDHAALRRLAHMLHRASAVYIHDIRFSTVRLALQGSLSLDGKTVTVSSDLEEQQQDIETMDTDSLLLSVLDGTPRCNGMSKLFVAAREKGAAITALSPSPDFIHSNLCAEIICLPMGSTSVSSHLISDMLFTYLDYLYHAECAPGQ